MFRFGKMDKALDSNQTAWGSSLTLVMCRSIGLHVASVYPAVMGTWWIKCRE